MILNIDYVQKNLRSHKFVFQKTYCVPMSNDVDIDLHHYKCSECGLEVDQPDAEWQVYSVKHYTPSDAVLEENILCPNYMGPIPVEIIVSIDELDNIE